MSGDGELGRDATRPAHDLVVKVTVGWRKDSFVSPPTTADPECQLLSPWSDKPVTHRDNEQKRKKFVLVMHRALGKPRSRVPIAHSSRNGHGRKFQLGQMMQNLRDERNFDGCRDETKPQRFLEILIARGWELYLETGDVPEIDNAQLQALIAMYDLLGSNEDVTRLSLLLPVRELTRIRLYK